VLARLRAAGPARRLGAGLLLLALALQAPAAGLPTRARVAEPAAADALIHAVICGQAPGTDGATAGTVTTDSATDSTIPAPADCDRCPFCRCTAAVPLPTPPTLAARRITRRRVAWPIPPPARPHRPSRANARARAPPLPV
jgi:hypothetical protein